MIHETSIYFTRFSKEVLPGKGFARLSGKTLRYKRPDNENSKKWSFVKIGQLLVTVEKGNWFKYKFHRGMEFFSRHILYSLCINYLLHSRLFLSYHQVINLNCILACSIHCFYFSMNHNWWFYADLLVNLCLCYWLQWTYINIA